MVRTFMVMKGCRGGRRCKKCKWGVIGKSLGREGGSLPTWGTPITSLRGEGAIEKGKTLKKKKKRLAWISKRRGRRGGKRIFIFGNPNRSSKAMVKGTGGNERRKVARPISTGSSTPEKNQDLKGWMKGGKKTNRENFCRGKGWIATSTRK